MKKGLIVEPHSPTRLGLVILALGMAFSACTNNLLPGTTAPGSSKPEIPYTSMEELNGLPRTKEFTSWRTSRFLILLEMEENYKKLYSWPDTYSLSERPVVIYETDSTPKYYEFYVLNSHGIEIATLTGPARKSEVPAPTAFVMQWVRDYKGAQTQSTQKGLANVVGGNYQVFATGYPTTMAVGHAYKGSRAFVYDSMTGKSIDSPEAPQDPLEENYNAIKALTAEDLAALGADPSENTQITTAYNTEKEKRLYYDKVTTALDSLEEEIASTSDTEIQNALSAARSMYSGNARPGSTRLKNIAGVAAPPYSPDVWFGSIAKEAKLETYFQSAIYDSNPNDKVKIAAPERLLNNTWAGWCGPSVFSWAYRGLEGKFRGKDVLLPGENPYRVGVPVRASTKGQNYYYWFGSSSDSVWIDETSNRLDNGLYAHFASALGIYGTTKGAAWPHNFGYAMKTASDNKYDVSYTGLSSAVSSHIRDRRLPAFTLVNAGKIIVLEYLQGKVPNADKLNIFQVLGIEPHYVVSIGSTDIEWHLKIWFWFWFFGRHDVYWDFHLWTNYYLYQYDNGAMIDDYGYEPFSQYQYGFGFYYPVVRK